ncbi:replication-associated recombination protein A [Pseudothermotoga thermarum]|uniref:AAA ATPase central domain protein n=1 Tax=Pseudothermotoga thermarum DSM 5069 TaxID=688269 RepID=F7YUP7_9THEM|nr:replication-associated recombination protein A [Pseudothermotoga thermarum]AEH50232.1 AAA ATPase central domain protein [Pseudothermotoga thermarum DSM 5069]
MDQRPSDAPLAERVRPKDLDDLVGQSHVMGKDGILRKALEKGTIFSCILYGPPGCGKSSIGELIRKYVNAEFYMLSGAFHGANEIKQILTRAQEMKKYGKQTVLFIDEIHRLNKSQQDVLLSKVEDGTIILVGATTENPSFEIIPPLLSRCRVIFLKPLSNDELVQIMKRALLVDEKISSYNITVIDNALKAIAQMSQGDARFALNTLEMAVENARIFNLSVVDVENLQKLIGSKAASYSKEDHYDFASAFIKSLRGSDPDAALYYMIRMIESGEDPRFIARRMVILASEDIGLADPMALLVAIAAAQAVEYVGLPECVLNLAQAAIYLAAAPKSNSVYLAVERAKRIVKQTANVQVPLFLRNPVTKLMKEAGYGEGYIYPHEAGGFVKRNYLPDELKKVKIYIPKEIGKEVKIKKRLMELWGEEKYKGEDQSEDSR